MARTRRYISEAQAEEMRNTPTVKFEPTVDVVALIENDESFFDVYIVPDDDARLGTTERVDG